MSGVVFALLLSPAAAAPSWVWEEGWPAGASAIDWSNSGDMLVVATGSALEIRDGRTGAFRGGVRASGAVGGASFFPDGLAVALLVEEVPCRWDLRSNTIREIGPAPAKGSAKGIEVAPAGNRMLVTTGRASFESTWSLYDVEKGGLVATGALNGSPHGDAAWPPGDAVTWLEGTPSRFVVAGTALEVRDGATGGLLSSVISPVGELRAVESAHQPGAPDRVAVGGLSSTFVVMDLDSGAIVARSAAATNPSPYAPPPTLGYRHLTWNADGTRVAGEFERRSVVVLTVATGTSHAWTGQPDAIAWSANGASLKMLETPRAWLWTWTGEAPEPAKTTVPAGLWWAFGPGLVVGQRELWRWDGGVGAPTLAAAKSQRTFSSSPSGPVLTSGAEKHLLDLATGSLHPIATAEVSPYRFADPAFVRALPAPAAGATGIESPSRAFTLLDGGRGVVAALSWKDAAGAQVAGLVCYDVSLKTVNWTLPGVGIASDRSAMMAPSSRKMPIFTAIQPGAFSPDGSTLYTCDGLDVDALSCAAWDVATGLKGTALPGIPITVSPAGQVLVASPSKQALLGWDPITQEAEWSDPFGAFVNTGTWGYTQQGWLVNLGYSATGNTPVRSWSPKHAVGASASIPVVEGSLRALVEPLPGILSWVSRGVVLYRVADGKVLRMAAPEDGPARVIITADGLIQAAVADLRRTVGGDLTQAPTAPGPEDAAYVLPDLLTRFLSGGSLAR